MKGVAQETVLQDGACIPEQLLVEEHSMSLHQCFWRTGSAHGAEGGPSPGPPCVSNSMFQTLPPWPLGWALLMSGKGKPIISS